jgi:hypothetical protein
MCSVAPSVGVRGVASAASLRKQISRVIAMQWGRSVTLSPRGSEPPLVVSAAPRGSGGGQVGKRRDKETICRPPRFAGSARSRVLLVQEVGQRDLSETTRSIRGPKVMKIPYTHSYLFSSTLLVYRHTRCVTRNARSLLAALASPYMGSEFLA